MELIITLFESIFMKGIEPGNISNLSKVSSVTKKVVNMYNTLTANEFFKKYACSKVTYMRRIKWYKDPYMNSPLAKIAKMVKRP